MNRFNLFLLLLFLGPGALAAESSSIGALYRTHIHPPQIHPGEDVDEAHAKTVEWFLWRDQDTVETRGRSSQVGEVWQRLTNGEVAYARLYHDKRFAIRYRPSDLRLVQAYSKWEAKASVIDPTLLRRLERVGRAAFGDYEVEQYSGTVDDQHLEVDWIPALAVPSRVRREGPGGESETKLVEVHPLAEVPWAPSQHRHYDDMDFADIGDNETHPVARMHLQGMDSSAIQYPRHSH